MKYIAFLDINRAGWCVFTRNEPHSIYVTLYSRCDSEDEAKEAAHELNMMEEAK